jgi:hypothetical protein
VLPVTPASLEGLAAEGPAAPEKLTMTSLPMAQAKPTVSPGPSTLRTRSLDSRSLDRLIARIAAGR